MKQIESAGRKPDSAIHRPCHTSNGKQTSYYELGKVKKCFQKLFKITFSRKNKYFGILLLPVVLIIWFTNKLRLEANGMAGKVLEGKRSISEYLLICITTEMAQYFLSSYLRVMYSILYTAAQKESLKDYLFMGMRSFKQLSVGDLSLRNYEKGSTVPKIIMSVIQDFYQSILLLVQALIKYYSISTILFSLILVISVVHLLIIILSTKRLSKLQQDYALSKIEISSVVTNEARNFEIMKAFDLQKSSFQRVDRVNKKRSTSKTQLSMFTSKLDFIIKTTGILSFIFVCVFTWKQMVNESLLASMLMLRMVHKTLESLFKAFLDINDTFFTFYLLEIATDSCAIQNSVEKLEFGAAIGAGIYDGAEMGMQEEARCLLYGNVNGSGLSLVVNDGEKVGIVCQNKSLQTRLLNVLAGIEAPEGGERVKIAYEKQEVALVTQEELIVEGSVMKNLRYGSRRSEEEVVEECKRYGVHGDFMNLEDGYGKYTKSGGLDLSGGQKQRVNILRGVLSGAKMLMFDECFSKINVSDRKRIIKTILGEDRTVLMAVPCSSFFGKFDKLVLLSDDRMCVGTYDELGHDLVASFAKK